MGVTLPLELWAQILREACGPLSEDFLIRHRQFEACSDTLGEGPSRTPDLVISTRKAVMLTCYNLSIICRSFLYDSIEISHPHPSPQFFQRLFVLLSRPLAVRGFFPSSTAKLEDADRVYGALVHGIYIPGRISNAAFKAFQSVLDVCPNLTCLRCDLELTKDSGQWFEVGNAVRRLQHLRYLSIRLRTFYREDPPLKIIYTPIVLPKLEYLACFNVPNFPMDHWHFPALRRAKFSSTSESLSVLSQHGHQLTSLELSVERAMEHSLVDVCSNLTSVSIILHPYSTTMPNLAHDRLKRISFPSTELKDLGCCAFKSILQSITKQSFPGLERVVLVGPETGTITEGMKLPIWLLDSLNHWMIEGIRLEFLQDVGKDVCGELKERCTFIEETLEP
ncbi:hypothetical protein SISSUDRAFT_1132446 [Sistotremastrum suecicum HHB10207 ss-3]|uniref:F-box domain-containing protein n=1 Tax=Sistotremastrum suecicum HHB10207 ss-3 TaxID=1314776 RepID=A0A165YTX1_9AGAM|nr:hypothetical protein SISSUDRAFT_1132446 [Sistotremastrum suecicum HHB10207 ss-3]